MRTFKGRFWQGLASAAAVVLLIAVLVIAQPQVESGDDDRSESIVRQAIAHYATHTQCKLEDIYKFVHQATFGPGHMQVDREQSAKYLLREWNALPSVDNGEHIFEPLGETYQRINLQAYKAEGGKVMDVLEAFMASMAAKSDTTLLDSTWTHTTRLLETTGLVPADSLASFTVRVRAADWPLYHHSEQYSKAYKPHYRVITMTEGVALMEKLGTWEP
ncbi:hypothetical protein KQI52_11035 [bacterium]|nr:hypothetical protein [bacterium]